MNLIEHQKKFLRQKRRLRTMVTITTLMYSSFPAAAIAFAFPDYRVWGLALGLLIFLAQGLISVRQVGLLKKGRLISLIQQMGSMRVLETPQNHQERLAIFIRNELALAAGIPAPQIVVLEEEDALNSFSIARDCSDSLIGLTQGALKKLKEPEMYAVMSLEMSKILLGFSQLNTKLWMTLYFFTRPTTVANRWRRTWQAQEKKNYLKWVGAYILKVVGVGGFLISRSLQSYFAKISVRPAELLAAGMNEGYFEIRKLYLRLREDSATSLNTDLRDEFRHLWMSYPGRGRSWNQRLTALPPSAQRPPASYKSEESLNYRSELSPYFVRASIGRVSGLGRQLATEKLKFLPESLWEATGTYDGARSLALALLLPTESKQQKAALALIQNQLGEALCDLVEKRKKEMSAEKVESKILLLQLAIGALHGLKGKELQKYLTCVHAVTELNEDPSRLAPFMASLITVSLDGHLWTSQWSKMGKQHRLFLEGLQRELQGHSHFTALQLAKAMLGLNQLHPARKEEVLLSICEASGRQGFADSLQIEKLRICALGIGLPLAPEIFH